MFSKLGGGGAAKQEKTVTAGTGVIEVSPDTGKLLSKVVVNPTPSQSKTVSPSTSQQTVSPDSGKLLSSVVVNAMPSGALADITVSTAGLITAQVGTSGYLASGTKKTKQLTTQAAKTVTPSESVQTAVSSGRYTTGAVKVAAIPSKYINLENMGFTKCAVDEFTFSSRTGGNAKISHSLGEIPKMFMIVTDTTPSTDQDIIELIAHYHGIAGSGANTGSLKYRYASNANGSMFASMTCVFADSYIKAMEGSGKYYSAGVTYKVITFA